MEHRFSDIAVSREMKDCLNAMSLEDLCEKVSIREIALDTRAPAHRPAMAVHEIVVADRHIPRLRESLARMASDIARTAGDQYRARCGFFGGCVNAGIHLPS